MRFRTHLINDNDIDKYKKGSAFWQGRWYLTVGRFEFQVSWNFKSTFCMLEFEYGGHDVEDFGFSIGLPPVALWFHITGILPKKWRNWHWPRATGLRIHNWSIWWNFWNDDSQSSSTDKWYRTSSFDIPDFFLGRNKYQEKTLEIVPVKVPLPERVYDGTCKIFESTWKRSRWPFKKRMIRTDLEVKEGLPIMGKGENSWDCGEDAIYSSTTPSKTAEQAVGEMVESVLNARRKYGIPPSIEPLLKEEHGFQAN